MHEIIFDHIANNRPRVAVFLSEFALSLKNTSVKEATRLRIVVNLGSAHMHCKNNESAMKVLDSVDWSATSDEYRICVAALMKNFAELADLLPRVKAAGTISANDFRDWPVFSFIRSEPRFTDAFRSTFGEDFERQPKRILDTVDEGAAIGISVDDSQVTKH